MKCDWKCLGTALRGGRWIGAVALVASLLASTAVGAPVSFWFGGHITSVENPSNAAPFKVTEGMPFTGRVTYDESLAEGSTNINSGGVYGLYYFQTVSGFSIMLQIDGHVITNAVEVDAYCGTAMASNDRFGSDYLLFESAGGSNLRLDGNAFTVYPRVSFISMSLYDDTSTAVNQANLPTQAPDLSRFQGLRELIWDIVVDDGKPTGVFRVTGEIVAVQSKEVVMLSQTRLSAAQSRLSWPTWNPGFTLQSTTNLVSGTWQNVTNSVVTSNRQHHVTVPVGGAQRFYRLKK